MRVDILIPTLGRHKAIQPLAASIINATPQNSYRVIFVADQGDTETQRVLDDLCFPGGVWHQLIEDGTYPHKINTAYRFGRGDLVLPTADDVVFHDGWYEAALKHFEAGAQVVGTNDLTPATRDGRHATMPIVTRSYIEGPGAVWGEPGNVFWGDYHHSFVETELWQLANHRGVAIFEPASVIEHRHPAWKSREVDDTDRKGNMQGWDADKALFESRKAQWLAS